MRLAKCAALTCVVGLVSLSCSGGGGEAEPGLRSFELKYCDSDRDCGTDFQCSPVYCPEQCVPGPDGRCLPCNGGHAGKCLPRPPTPCSATTCPSGQVCKELCTGACDATTGKCSDVQCFAACVPDEAGCAKDSDCQKGYHCEVACARCNPPAGAAEGPGFPEGAPRCIGEDTCIGRCVKDPPACDFDRDCPAGFVCEPVMCPMVCAPDGKGGCLPCNGGKMGQCVPEPSSGCKSDADCKGNQVCRQFCAEWCDAFATSDAPEKACKSECRGECVPASPSCEQVKCPPGTECQEVCSACAGEAAERAAMMGPAGPDGAPVPCGACWAQCVPLPPPPVACDSDKDCPPGARCEPVYCDLKCLPDGKGGCLPCNNGKWGQCVPDTPVGCSSDAECRPGERCETVCMGACEPMGGCYEQCFGQCVPAQGGCQSDADCGKGQRCEWLCNAACPAGGAAFAGRPADFRAPACEGECFGRCVDTGEPTRCNTDADCPKGQVCELVYCAMSDAGCFPGEKGGCAPMPPCNDGWLGQCVPAPTQGCASDKDCDPGMTCRVMCFGACAPGTGCAETCVGECVPKQSGCGPDQPCPPGYECRTMCPDCGPALDCFGECFGQCVPANVPTRCNSDAECGPGYHCELVFCTMECMAPADGDMAPPPCLPCNEGYLGVCTPNAQSGCKDDSACAADQRCEVRCTGLCDPSGCKEQCFGQCVPKAGGCESNEDCGAGFVCETVCPPCGGGLPSEPAGFAPAPPCLDAECRGQCVPAPTGCGNGATCPPGQTCVETAKCPPCVYSETPCMMPCKLVYECVPSPAAGCKQDSDCPSGRCMVACPVTCTPQGCATECRGECV